MQWQGNPCLEALAEAAGYAAIWLETGTEQPEAMALYPSWGYLPIPPYGEYAGDPLSRYFAKDLRPAKDLEDRGSTPTGPEPAESPPEPPDSPWPSAPPSVMRSPWWWPC